MKIIVVKIVVFLSFSIANSIKLRGRKPFESTYNSCIWLVVWNILYFSIYWEESFQLTFHIFQRG